MMKNEDNFLNALKLIIGLYVVLFLTVFIFKVI